MSIGLCISIIIHSVGFDIAYPRVKGNARAYKSGMSDETRIPALFLCALNELFFVRNRESAEWRCNKATEYENHT